MANAAMAQQLCGSDVFHHTKMQNNPAYKLRTDNIDAAWSRNQSSARTVDNTTMYTIPVVFHIMHKGEPVGEGTNISDAAILGTLKTLNERYRNIPGIANNGSSVDMQVEFALAVRDPNGNCTNGITRYEMTGHQNYMDHGVKTYISDGITNEDLKALDFWDSNTYANVWVVSAIENYGGYSSFASDHGTPTDGIVIVYTSINDPYNSTLTHEFGHYLNLLHVFEGSNAPACPANNDCTMDGDKICDTAPCYLMTVCDTSAENPCTPGEMYGDVLLNIMSYACNDQFTAGQKNRVRDALVGPRASLLEENGNMAFVPSVAPGPDFIITDAPTCFGVGSELRFRNTSSCVPNTQINSLGWKDISFTWTLTSNHGTMLTSHDQNATFIIPEEGTYSTTLSITTPLGTKTIIKQNIITAGLLIPATSCIASSLAVSDCASVDYGRGIYEVSFGGFDHTSGSLCEDITAGVTNGDGYGDFSCTYTAHLLPNTLQTIKIAVGESASERVRVYIDFNNDGIDENDLVTSDDNLPPGPALYSMPPFMTPVLPVFNTKLRMRIVDEDGETGDPAVCEQATVYGQVHDYSVIFDNALPIALDDDVTIRQNTVATIDVVANDSDPDGTVFPFTIDFSSGTQPFFLKTVDAAEGTWTSEFNSSYVTFKPAADFIGIAKQTYTIGDNLGGFSNIATITVTVLPPNLAPRAVNDSATTPINKPVSFKIVLNDTDADGTIDASSIDLDPDSSGEQKTKTSANASWSVNASGEVTFTPDDHFSGLESITYTVKDNDGAVSNIAVIGVEVLPEVVTAVTDEKIESYSLYPNPFKQFVICHLTLTRQSHVRLSIVDMLGQQVEFINRGYDAGEFEVLVPLEALGAGIYFYTLTVEERVYSGKLMKGY